MEPISTGLALAMPLIKAGIGGAQMLMGNKMGKNAQRPTMTTPQSAVHHLNNAKAAALSSRLPGQSRMENQITGSSSEAVRKILESGTNPAAIMSAITAINQNENDAMGNLNVKGAEYQDTNQQRLQGALLTDAAYQEKNWDYNVNQPYQNKVQAAEGLKGAGLQNLMNNGTDIFGILSLLGKGQQAGNGMFNRMGRATPATGGGRGLEGAGDVSPAMLQYAQTVV